MVKGGRATAWCSGCPRLSSAAMVRCWRSRRWRAAAAAADPMPWMLLSNACGATMGTSTAPMASVQDSAMAAV